MRYFIITYGCQMNKSDSERIATVLESKGYQPASNINEADLIVVNMCSVRQSAVDRVYGKIKDFAKLKIKSPKLKVILTGCILKEDKRKFAKEFDSILNIKDLLKEQPKYQNNFSAFIPISRGCNNFCTYCVVPFTRGSLACRSHREILKEVKDIVKKGFKEIWLLGQNVNDYHSPNNPKINFARLLKMADDIKGNFKLLFVSPHPKNFSEELINALTECKKFGKYLNLPVQSGDNKILKAMNRPYTAEQYKNLVKKIRKKIPALNLSTDIIVGFPGETKSQFENTVKLFKEIQFDMAYLSKYSPRPGTAAFRMEDNVPLEEKKRRWKILNDILFKKMGQKIKTKNPKLIVILGPTASGKSELAIKLARKFKGEIVSADSRQVYRDLDIGTAKVAKKSRGGIPHHLLDVVSPKRTFTVVQYQKFALKAINKIQKKGKIPFLVGGTGFYIQAVIDGIIIPEVKPDWKLRKKLEKKSVKDLYKTLKKIDPRRAKTIEKENPRRLIRAIEIVLKTKKPVPALQEKPVPYPVLMLGIKKGKKELSSLIRKRFFKWLKKGLIKEVKNLKKFGISWKKIEGFGIHYRVIAQYLQKKLCYKEMVRNSIKEIQNYYKRQMTWFKREKRIKWIKNYKHAEKLTKNFLTF